MNDAERTLYRFGDFELDARRRRLVRRDGSVVPVTARVFDMLLHLVENPDRLVGKQELLDAVWGKAVVEENNLAQGVSALRRLLGDPTDDPRYIVTVPGRGYRFIARVERVPGEGAQPEAAAAVAAADAAAPPAMARPATEPEAPPARWGVPRPVAYAAAAVAIGVLAALLAIGWRSSSSPPRVLAVLPFKSLLPDQRDAALELGMADALISRLSASRALVVRPLGSVRRYDSPAQNPLAAGGELGVDAVLDGSIARDGDRIRVTARLLRVADGTAVWVGQFDQPFTDVFAVQDAIATQLAGALALRLTAEERVRFDRRATADPAAYRDYLLGRLHWSRLTPQELRTSIQFFERAIAADPGYALAYAGLAEAYRALPITADVRPLDVLPPAKAAAARALALDPQLAPAHASACFIGFWLDHDWSGAERSCRAAIAADPNDADGYRAYAVLLSDLGRHAEAIAAARRARELDPLTPVTCAIEGHVLHYAGRDAEALERLRACLVLQPEFWVAHLFVGKIQLRAGQPAAALASFERAAAGSHGNSEAISLAGYARAQLGDRAGAQRALDELIARGATSYVPPFNVALLYEALGDADRALDWLARAEADRDVRLTFLRVEWKWDPLRTDPRFTALVGRMGLDAAR